MEPATPQQEQHESQTPLPENIQVPPPSSLPEEPPPIPMKIQTRRSPWGIIIGFVGVICLIIGVFVVLRTFKKVNVETQMGPSVVSSIKKKGKIVIGTDSTFPPMEFVNDAGEYTGYDIELGRRIAEKLGVTPEFKPILFDNFIDELKNHTVDIVMSSVSITDERKSQVQFSDPYLYAGQVILTRKDNTSISTTDDLKGKRIAVQKGTTNEQQAREFTSGELVLLFDDYSLATQALLSASADAIFSDLTGAKGIIDANPDLKVASEPFTKESYGIVFSPGENDLIPEVNSILNSLRQQGVLTLLKQKWLD